MARKRCLLFWVAVLLPCLCQGDFQPFSEDIDKAVEEEIIERELGKLLAEKEKRAGELDIPDFSTEEEKREGELDIPDFSTEEEKRENEEDLDMDSDGAEVREYEDGDLPTKRMLEKRRFSRRRRSRRSRYRRRYRISRRRKSGGFFGNSGRVLAHVGTAVGAAVASGLNGMNSGYDQNVDNDYSAYDSGNPNYY